jgi:tRNASer (uridine44-2'-O)-methyltransferase
MNDCKEWHYNCYRRFIVIGNYVLYNLLILYSLGTQEGYQKRVHHDVLVDKSAYQDLYISIKNKYAKSLIRDWVETTDPLKHVFEDISLAAFLILLWKERPKFVDIGCGNGVLVYLLTMEGYEGNGFDARRRKSWTIFPQHVQDRLFERILIPHFLAEATTENCHNGKFDDGTFLISNHADELTPYTPILAALTPNSGFLAIPCCEHDFSGAKVAGPLLKPVKDIGKYGMYCEWICKISREMGWAVETEMLRIPSTRNVGIVGRHINCQGSKEMALEVIKKIGGQNGYEGFVERAKGLKDRIHRH